MIYSSLLSACVFSLFLSFHSLPSTFALFFFVFFFFYIQYLNRVEVRLSECNVSDCYTDLLEICCPISVIGFTPVCET